VCLYVSCVHCRDSVIVDRQMRCWSPTETGLKKFSTNSQAIKPQRTRPLRSALLYVHTGAKLSSAESFSQVVIPSSSHSARIRAQVLTSTST
jgi:hypothetical protein